MEWKPIETMPKDGTLVLLYGGETYEVGNQPPLCSIGKWTYSKLYKSWVGRAFSFKPTHWREIPKFKS